MSSLNSIFLAEPPFFRKVGRNHIVRDASSFPFMIEEIVSCGAIDIAILSHAFSVAALKRLPPILRQRIKIIDSDLRVAKTDRVIREPISHAFGVKRRGVGITFEKKLPRDVEEALVYLEFSWYHFLVGLEYALQIDVDVNHLRQVLARLRAATRNLEARAVLATFSGVLATYQSSNVGAVTMLPSNAIQLAETFQRLIEDETYRSLSRQFHAMGFPQRLVAGAERIAVLTKRLVRKTAFKNVLNIGSIAVTAATQTPLPESDLGERLLRKRYLPPIVSLSPAMNRARQAWLVSGEKFESLNGYS